MSEKKVDPLDFMVRLEKPTAVVEVIGDRRASDKKTFGRPSAKGGVHAAQGCMFRSYEASEPVVNAVLERIAEGLKQAMVETDGKSALSVGGRLEKTGMARGFGYVNEVKAGVLSPGSPSAAKIGGSAVALRELPVSGDSARKGSF